jgi:hypothetical protein
VTVPPCGAGRLVASSRLRSNVCIRLLLGAVGGYYTPLEHTTIARAMTFASGVLLAVVAVDLVITGRGTASLHWTGNGYAVWLGGIQFHKLVTLPPRGTASKTLRRMRGAAGRGGAARVADWPSRPARSSTAFPRGWCWG